MNVQGGKSRSDDEMLTMQECCICGQGFELIRPHLESRPTGHNGETEIWGYCSKCWGRMTRLRQGNVDLGRIYSKVIVHTDVAPKNGHQEVGN